MAVDQFGNPLTEEERWRLMMQQQRMGLTPAFSPTTTPMLGGPAVDTFVDMPATSPTQQPFFDFNSQTYQPTHLVGPTVNKFEPLGSDYTPQQLSTPIKDLQQQNIPSNVVPIDPQLAMTRFERSKLQLPIGPFTPLPDLNVPAFTPVGPTQQVPARIRQTIPTANDPTGGLSATDSIFTGMPSIFGPGTQVAGPASTIGPVTATRQGADWVDPDSQKFGTDQLSGAPVLSHDYMSRDLGLEPVSGYVDGMGMPIHTGLRYPGQSKTDFELSLEPTDYSTSWPDIVPPDITKPVGFFPWPMSEEQEAKYNPIEQPMDFYDPGPVSTGSGGGFRPGFGSQRDTYAPTQEQTKPSREDIQAAINIDRFEDVPVAPTPVIQTRRTTPAPVVTPPVTETADIAAMVREIEHRNAIRDQVTRDLMETRDRGTPSHAEVQAAINAMMGNEFGGLLAMAGAEGGGAAGAMGGYRGDPVGREAAIAARGGDR